MSSVGGNPSAAGEFEIRERREADLDQLEEVARRVRAVDGYPIYLPDDDARRFLCRPQPIAAWVAVADGRVLGHVALNASTSEPVMAAVAAVDPERPAAYVARLLVAPTARRSGVGRALLARARGHAVEAGFLPALDVVDGPNAAAAIALYRSEGWSQIARVSFRLADLDVDELVFVVSSI